MGEECLRLLQLPESSSDRDDSIAGALEHITPTHVKSQLECIRQRQRGEDVPLVANVDFGSIDGIGLWLD